MSCQRLNSNDKRCSWLRVSKLAVALLYVNLSAFLVGPNCVQSTRSSREKCKKKNHKGIMRSSQMEAAKTMRRPELRSRCFGSIFKRQRSDVATCLTRNRFLTPFRHCYGTYCMRPLCFSCIMHKAFKDIHVQMHFCMWNAYIQHIYIHMWK